MTSYRSAFIMVVLSTIAICLTTSTYGRQTKTTPKQNQAAPTPKENLSDDFARSGIKALRAIERSFGMPSVMNGAISVPRDVQQLIDDADAEARASEERAVVEALNKFYLGRLINNLEKDLIRGHGYNAASEAAADQKLATDPRAAEMNSRETKCSALLDDILRSRRYSEKPGICFEVNPPKASPTH